jgi:glycine oxidase
MQQWTDYQSDIAPNRRLYDESVKNDLAQIPDDLRGEAVIVVGGGIIGLSCAWHLSRSGWAVSVMDPDPGFGAGWVAAGMLAPASEAHFGEDDHVRLLDTSARVWPSFRDEIERATDRSIGFRQSGTLLVGLDGGDKAEIDRAVEFQRSMGYEIDDADPGSLEALEPELSRHVRVVRIARGDHNVNPRLVLQALMADLRSRGVAMITDRAVRISLERGAVRLEGSDGSVHLPSRVLVTMGAHTNLLDGLDALGAPSIRPVKGHVVRLSGPPLLTHTIRAVVRGRPIYLVPRADGELVVGATAEEKGYDLRVQAGEIFRLLDDARQVVPGVDDLEFKEASCGLRPAPSDNLPVVGWLERDRVAIATGHYRNGVLLAPLTGQVVASLLGGWSDEDLNLFGAPHG